MIMLLLAILLLLLKKTEIQALIVLPLKPLGVGFFRLRGSEPKFNQPNLTHSFHTAVVSPRHPN